MKTPKHIQQRPFVVACGVLGKDLVRLGRIMDLEMGTKFLPGGLHENPEKLRTSVQKVIDEVSDDDRWSRIIVGYGVCGRGTVGLQARRLPLVLPRVHDCIALFLGSDQAYRHQFRRYPGTYYISAGWYEEKAEPLSQRRPYIYLKDQKIYFNELAEKVGTDGAAETFRFMGSWKANYQRAAYIDTGDGTDNRYSRYARQLARQNSWRYETIKGDPGLMTRLLTADAPDDQVLWVPPGQMTVFDPLGTVLDAKPMADGHAASKNTGMMQWTVGDDQHKPVSQLVTGLGIDAGGTYTDAVLYDFSSRQVLAQHKALTTPWDYASGIEQALGGLPADKLAQVDLVSLSTTLATNAIVEGQGQRVGLLLMPPEGLNPADGIDHRPCAAISGRLTIDGREVEPVDQDQIAKVARNMVEQQGVDAFAVSGYAGHVNPAHELIVKKILIRVTGKDVCCGHELSHLLNFKTRARTAVFNARIIPRLVQLKTDIDRVLAGLNISAPVMVVKGDGSLVSGQMAVQRPVETVLSGPAASVAGAQFLTGRGHAMVVDMGGTTTDTAMIRNHRVRLCDNGAHVGGRHTHVKALDIRTAGLGGDSRIAFHEGELEVGPQRVTPIAWLGSQGHDLSPAFTCLQRHIGRFKGSSRRQVILALNQRQPIQTVSDGEAQILERLARRPYGLDELAQCIGALHPGALPLQRLVDRAVICRSALTPTDLLHVSDQMTLWDKTAARQMAALVADSAGLDMTSLIGQVMDHMVRQMAMEIIAHHFQTGSQTGKAQAAVIDGPWMDRLFGHIDDGFRVSVNLAYPVVGIGAPIGFFLPRVGQLLGAEVMLPPHQDVANAIGAITSQVVVTDRVSIKPDPGAGFYIEGLAGGQASIEDLDQAQDKAVADLVARVRETARLAGTRQRRVQIRIKDRLAQTAGGQTVFLERLVSARLSGPPDNQNHNAAPTDGRAFKNYQAAG